MESNYKLYHLVRPSEHGPSDQQDKMVTEIYLTRRDLFYIVWCFNLIFDSTRILSRVGRTELFYLMN